MILQGLVHPFRRVPFVVFDLNLDFRNLYTLESFPAFRRALFLDEIDLQRIPFFRS